MRMIAAQAEAQAGVTDVAGERRGLGRQLTDLRTLCGRSSS